MQRPPLPLSRTPALTASRAGRPPPDSAPACSLRCIIEGSNYGTATLLDKRVKPSFIVRYLDQYVIGQDEAKKVMAVAVYSHYKKIEKAQQDGVEMAKSN